MLRILTTLYNALPFIGKCIATITEQSVRDWRCYVLNDLCTDGSDKLVAGLAKRDDRIVIINHSQKLYQVGGYLHALARPEVADDDICISIDGDDWLPDVCVSSGHSSLCRSQDLADLGKHAYLSKWCHPTV